MQSVMQKVEVDLSGEEIEALAHALEEELRRVKESGGNHYGPLSLEEAHELVERLQKQVSRLLSAAVP